MPSKDTTAAGTGEQAKFWKRLDIAGDLLLVAVFHMGTAGAAIATVFAQAVSVLLSLLVIRRRTLPFAFHRRFIRLDWGIIKNILFSARPSPCRICW